MDEPSPAASRRRVLKLRGDKLFEDDDDRVVVEEPLLIKVEGESFAVVMRTPGSDAELAAGFLHAERVVRSAEDLLAIEHGADPEDPERGNVVDARLGQAARERLPADRRLTVARSSCGVCGRRSIEEIMRTAPPIRSTLRVSPRVIDLLPERILASQQVFRSTGGLHAAALFDAAGNLALLREDVGRHNAVDKVVGHALLGGALPLHESLLMVSGRAGFEIVEKAVLAGIPIVCAVSAPSSLALDLARTADLAVVGFLRPGGMNVYTSAHRIEL